jgi:hypothetical protein
MTPMTVSEAKPHLGKLADAALKGQGVFIRRGSEVLQLVRAVMPDPIPVYPFGALARGAVDIARLSATATADEAVPFLR